MENIDDIIKRILKGDKDFFGNIMDYYFKEIFSYVYNMTGSYSESEDITQEIFIKIYKELGKFDNNRASFRTWLYRIAHNYAINYLKSSKYRKSKNLAEYDDNFNQSELDIEQEIVKEEQINQVVQIMNRVLIPKHLEIMKLHYFSNLTVNEISDVLLVPNKTIYKAIKTSTEKIKKEVSTDE